MEIDPFNTKAMNNLAYYYSSEGQLDTALKYVDRYIALRPDEAVPFNTKGVRCNKKRS